MTTDTVLIRPASIADVPALQALVQSAYRGDSARDGWTHEADLVEGERITQATLAAVLSHPDERIFVAERGGMLIGSVQISDRGSGIGYLGLLSVAPRLQAAGLGKTLIAAAEREAVKLFGATMMEISVIERRAELIAYYERRGYVRTGEYRPFPIPMTPPLRLMMMAKRFR